MSEDQLGKGKLPEDLLVGREPLNNLKGPIAVGRVLALHIADWIQTLGPHRVR